MKANEFLTEAGIIDKLKGVFKGKSKPAAQPAGQWPPAAGGPKVWSQHPDRDPVVPPKPVPSATRKPRTPGKNAFGQMANQLADRPETMSQGSTATNQMVKQLTKRPGMKVKKTDPRTALGMKGKGGSPEYQAALAQMQQDAAARQQATAPAPTTTPKAKTKKKVATPVQTDPQVVGGEVASNNLLARAKQGLTPATKAARQRDAKTGRYTSSSTATAPTKVAPSKAAPRSVAPAQPSVPGVDQSRLAKSIALSMDEITDPSLLQSIKAKLDKKLGL